MNRQNPCSRGLSRRSVGLALLGTWPLTWAAAAMRHDRVVPLYGAEGFLRSHRQFGAWPAARTFALEAGALAQALAVPAEGPAALETLLRQARPAWVRTLEAWIGLSTIATGPVVERRSIKALDFQPSRPELIRKAIERAADGPLDTAAMERVGTPAKGLPALEWLLWSSAAEVPRAPALRHYLMSTSADLAREARELADAWQESATAPLDEEAVAAGVAELINQMLGAVELLRWRDIERPARAGAADKLGYPRQRSRQTALAWATAWRVLREALHTPADWPEPGRGLVSLGLYLRSVGHVALADRLDVAVEAIDPALSGLKPASPRTRQLQAGAALARLKGLIENEVASAIQVRIGFSDNDGD